jgi:hypothetical protein
MLQTVPLIYDTLEHAASLTASMCPEGFIGISGNTLRSVSSGVQDEQSADQVGSLLFPNLVKS